MSQTKNRATLHLQLQLLDQEYAKVSLWFTLPPGALDRPDWLLQQLCTMSNRVWVRWKNSTSNEWSFDKVTELNDDADISEPRKAFVKQQCLEVSPGTLEVRETENGDKLREDATLKDCSYFMSPEGSAGLPGPGKIRDTALFLTLPPQTQNINNRFDPLFAVLPDLLREVNLSRRSRLNPWERESARTTASKRSDKCRKKVIASYGRATNSKKNVKCQVLDELTPNEEAQDKIIAAHIWKASTRRKGLEDCWRHASHVNSARNGLFLTKGVEDAFEKKQVCFVYNVLESRLFLWVADCARMSETILGSTRKFSDVHQKPLPCSPNHLPFRRLVAWHARLTLDLWKESLQGLDYTSEYDNSPGREHVKREPIVQAIAAMVEPGEDASLGNN